MSIADTYAAGCRNAQDAIRAAHATKPKPPLGLSIRYKSGGGECLGAQVDESGWCRIRVPESTNPIVEPKEALKLADWIYENYGRGKP